MAKRTDQFQTIRTEGALLPPDILQAITSLTVEGVSPEAYHLPPGAKLNEAIARSWSMLQQYWKGFQEDRELLEESATGTEVTNRQWLLPLFEELKYGRLTTVKSPEIDGRTYPVERFYSDQPIHLIGCNLPLDRRTTGARGAATASPHSMMQEFLNRTDESLWGFLSNGLRLRVLRDNVSLSRQAYIEFDLEAMMEGEVYADFAILWMICHQSRIEAETPQEFWLETWSQLAREQGTRVLADLRNGVTQSIEALGRGFIAHPRNDVLRESLHSGQLDTQDYYRQLLRIVYRLLFLFVAEDRKLLHPPDAETDACELYDTYYSTRRLRELADQIRGSKHADLWHSLSLVFERLNRDEGCPELGLVGLGSFLWNPENTPDLLGPHQAEDDSAPILITNDELLTAVRALAYTEQDKVRRAVDYRNLGSEELGSVYEALLELHPVMNVPARAFDLSIAAGNERKTSGSYYTPDSLVQCLLDSALDPVVEDRLKGNKGEEAEQALLDLKVCDPACGSGHFLIAAAHRLARHLARVRTGESEPSPEDYQHALRDVIGRCVYGVDLNPMAVELCKVSLWMEALEPGKPLSFLDHHIQCGNSLLGSTPKLLADGLPNDAFKAIEADDRDFCRELKRDNRRERDDFAQGQRYTSEPFIKLGNLPTEFARLSILDDESLADVADKEHRYAEMVKGTDYLNARLLADTWCSVFVWKKDTSDLGKLCPTERGFRSIEDNPHSILPHVKDEVRRLADQYQFFHWHLAFPDVFILPEEDEQAENEQTGWNGGFDVVLGNPPWEKIKLQEKEWFKGRRPEISKATSAAKRMRLICQLETEDPSTFRDYLAEKRFADCTSHFIRESGVFPLCGRGDVNTYSVFSETNRNIVSLTGRAGFIVPSGIATDSTTSLFFNALVSSSTLESFFDFENAAPLFENVHRSYKFALITLAGPEVGVKETTFAFFAHKVGDLANPGRQFRLGAEDIQLLNPNTGTVPVFRSAQDSILSKGILSRVGVLIRESNEESGNPWGLRYFEVFHSAHDSAAFVAQDSRPPSDGELLQFYEGKQMHQFDHRWASYVEGSLENVDRRNPLEFSKGKFLIPRSYIQAKLSERWGYKWRLVWRVVARSTDERTLITAIVPEVVPSEIATIEKVDKVTFLLGCLNSFVADYVARQKAGGPALRFHVFKQLAIPSPGFIASQASNGVESLIDACVQELTYTAWDIKPFAADCGYDGPPFRWDEERRFLLRCELDAAYFHLYLGPPDEWGSDSPQLREMFPTPRDAVEYIMETFPIVKRKDIARTEVKDDKGEVTTEGTYITKETILSIYDEMQQAIDSGQPYQTRLDPPPGPPTDADGNFIPMAQWDEADWPSHVHQPREIERQLGTTGAD